MPRSLWTGALVAALLVGSAAAQSPLGAEPTCGSADAVGPVFESCEAFELESLRSAAARKE